MIMSIVASLFHSRRQVQRLKCCCSSYICQHEVRPPPLIITGKITTDYRWKHNSSETILMHNNAFPDIQSSSSKQMMMMMMILTGVLYPHLLCCFHPLKQALDLSLHPQLHLVVVIVRVLKRLELLHLLPPLLLRLLEA